MNQIRFDSLICRSSQEIQIIHQLSVTEEFGLQQLKSIHVTPRSEGQLEGLAWSITARTLNGRRLPSQRERILLKMIWITDSAVRKSDSGVRNSAHKARVTELFADRSTQQHFLIKDCTLSSIQKYQRTSESFWSIDRCTWSLSTILVSKVILAYCDWLGLPHRLFCFWRIHCQSIFELFSIFWFVEVKPNINFVRKQ